MVEFLLFCIATVGMTSIIVQGVIFLPFRRFIGNWAERVHQDREQKAHAANQIPRWSLIEWFNELINCAQCTGFWCGLFCGLFLLTSENYEGTGIMKLTTPAIIRFESTHDGTIESTISTVPKIESKVESNFLVMNRLLMWFCCGVGGSFLSAFGSHAIEWVFYRKMNALRQWEEQDLMLAARRAELPETPSE